MDNSCVSGDVDTDVINNVGAEYTTLLPIHAEEMNVDGPFKERDHFFENMKVLNMIWVNWI